jgi:SAM-dependent methyltransferase
MDASSRPEPPSPHAPAPHRAGPPRGDTAFTGAVAELYDRLLGPMIFEPYAADLAVRVAALAPARVLETAAGTGVATRALARALPAQAALVATDLNQAMLDRAAAVGAGRTVGWRQADATDLPFGDASFDAVACQFGAMFFPDKVRGFAEARRVLRPGGALHFSVWDRIEENDFAEVVTAALARLYPGDPPRFLARTPHGYFDLDAMARDLAAAGFPGAPHFDTVTARSPAPSAQVVALALCQGTPLRGEIETRKGPGLAEATAACAAALEARFGAGPIEGRMQAHVVSVRG